MNSTERQYFKSVGIPFLIECVESTNELGKLLLSAKKAGIEDILLSVLKEHYPKQYNAIEKFLILI